MENFQKLSETEMELMQAIWEMDRPVKSSELLNLFAQKKGKDWKGQTIATFLSRLVDKGLLSVTREGRSNIYQPYLSPEEYKRFEAQSLLDGMYQGSIKNFLSALYDGNKVTEKEINELKQWFSEK